MNIKQITKKMSFSGQLLPEYVQEIADRGVMLVINNRPDGEESSQVSSSAIEEAVILAGMKYLYLPIMNRDIPQQAIVDFNVAMSKNEKVHAFCRTGARSSIVWAMAQASSMNPDKIIQSATDVGIDLSGILATLVTINAIT